MYLSYIYFEYKKYYLLQMQIHLNKYVMLISYILED